MTRVRSGAPHSYCTALIRGAPRDWFNENQGRRPIVNMLLAAHLSAPTLRAGTIACAPWRSNKQHALYQTQTCRRQSRARVRTAPHARSSASLGALARRKSAGRGAVVESWVGEILVNASRSLPDLGRYRARRMCPGVANVWRPHCFAWRITLATTGQDSPLIRVTHAPRPRRDS